jgi:hypothetical protein
VQFRIDAGKPDRVGCAPLTLFAALPAGGFVPLIHDDCLPFDGAMKGLEQKLEFEWAPDQARLAIAWNVLRQPASRDDAAISVWRGHFAVVPRRKLVTIDLLDAGAGDALLPLRQKLEGLFTVAHQGKALKPRPKTVIYFAPGFEAVAQDIALLVAGPEVKPLDFSSPFAITVAAAR